MQTFSDDPPTSRGVRPVVQSSASSANIARVLVVDDEPDLLELLELTLVRMGLDVDRAMTVGEARDRLAQRSYALCLTDMRLPDASGMDLVALISRDYPATPVAVITAFGSTENAVAALKAGAFDYLSKPVALDHLRSLVQSAVRAYGRDSRERESERTRGSGPKSGAKVSENGDAPFLARLLGGSTTMAEVRALIRRVALSQAPVAISGESGSGKELAARAVHDCSGRRDGPFVAVTCGAIPEQLVEAEFFGYRKGAFTGADADRDGFFQTAKGGTLFLDEVADLPLAMQVKLLRAIQERSVRRVGGMNEESVDVRLISATHQNLAQCVMQGRFRQDLFYRLNVIDIRIPSLRERREDIPLLARHLLATLAPDLTLSQAAIDKLSDYDFPGNVRELGNILERSAALAESAEIGPDDLNIMGAASAPLASSSPAPRARSEQQEAAPVAPVAPVAPSGANAIGLVGTLADFLDDIERDLIEKALAQTRYNRTAAADLLGITFRQLRYRMQRLNIQ
ncbi:MAG: sigma-54 dependent transcriptional regulator [Burkholderiaceae bacterium]